MNKKAVIAGVGAALLIAIAVVQFGRSDETGALVLHGNVDIRQIELPFADSERIAEVLVEEGDAVKAGQVLARLETARIQPRVAQVEARVAAVASALLRLRNGARPEEIAQARAAVASAQADAANARSQYERLQAIGEASDGRAISAFDLDAAQAGFRTSEARVETAVKALALVLAGPRQEDIAQAQADRDGARAELALLQRQLQDAELKAPTDAVVRSRLMEPGELATPQRPVFSLAVTHPKWVRAYISETALGRLRIGMPASVTTDSFPDAPLDGALRFISSVAEFTPKTVETQALRTSLVYEVRVFVADPEDRLKLGMPATVRIQFTDDADGARIQ